MGKKKASIKRTVDYSTKPISIKSKIKYGKAKKKKCHWCNSINLRYNPGHPLDEFGTMICLNCGRTQA